MKAVSEIFSPVSGEVTAIESTRSPIRRKKSIRIRTAAAWLVKVQLADPKEALRADGRRRLRSLHRRPKRRNTRPDALSSQESIRTRGDAGSHRRRIGRTNFSSPFPEKFRLREPLTLPGPLSETEIIQYFQARAAENSRGYTSFLGAGVYHALALGGHGCADAARRISHVLHAVPGGNLAGHA